MVELKFPASTSLWDLGCDICTELSEEPGMLVFFAKSYDGMICLVSFFLTR